MINECRCISCIHEEVCCDSEKYCFDTCIHYLKKKPHGEWKDMIEITLGTCSNCGEFGVVGDFCMWCGADMRGDEE